MISEYPKDRLYLRVGILLRKLMECAHDGNICNNLQLYLYLKQIACNIDRHYLLKYLDLTSTIVQAYLID